MKTRNFAWPLLLIAYSVSSMAFGMCDKLQYFSAMDQDHSQPLSKPTKEFTTMLNRARQGDAIAQRSLAVSYETGYLVSECDEAAWHWYLKAANGNDELALAWIKSKMNALLALQGPQYVHWTGHTTVSTLVVCASSKLPAGRYFQYGLDDTCKQIKEHSGTKDITAIPALHQRESNISANNSATDRRGNDDEPQRPRRRVRSFSSPPAVNSGAVNPFTGEFYAPAGNGYVSTRTGTFFAPAGPNGVIDTRTGRFVTVH